MTYKASEVRKGSLNPRVLGRATVFVVFCFVCTTQVNIYSHLFPFFDVRGDLLGLITEVLELTHLPPVM